MKTGKHIHHKMCGNGGERTVNVWVLNDKGKKTPVSFLVDGYEPETKTVYQFHVNLGMRRTNIKKVWFEKKFTPYPYSMVYDFEATLAPLNEHPTDDLTYLSRHIAISVAIHDTLSKEPLYLVDENSERLIERFIEVLTEK